MIIGKMRRDWKGGRRDPPAPVRLGLLGSRDNERYGPSDPKPILTEAGKGIANRAHLEGDGPVAKGAAMSIPGLSGDGRIAILGGTAAKLLGIN